MHWMTIITTLVLAAISSFLVAFQGWNATDAFMVVGVVAVVLILGLVGILLALSNPQDRREMMRDMLATMRGDLNDLLRWMRVMR